MRKENDINMPLVKSLVSAAKGTRTQAEYARAAGVTTTLLSRLLNGERRPSPAIIEKLTSYAAQPQNGVTFDELMIAAGHQTPINIEPIEDPSPRDEITEFTQTAEKLVTENLIENKWIISSNFERNNASSGIFTIHIDKNNHSKIKEWKFFCLTPNKSFTVKDRSHIPYTPVLSGKRIRDISDLVHLKPDDELKVSFVYSNEAQYSTVLKVLSNGCSYRGNFSIILIDVNSSKILDEKYICTYYEDNFFEPQLNT